MHEHCQEQTPRALIDPHHEHSIRRQKGEEHRGHVEERGKLSSSNGTSQVVRKKVPRSPQEAHAEAGGKDAVTWSKLGYRETRPSKLLDEAVYESKEENEQYKRSFFATAETEQQRVRSVSCEYARDENWRGQ